MDLNFDGAHPEKRKKEKKKKNNNNKIPLVVMEHGIKFQVSSF